jgi:serine/threonine protein kinase
MLPMTDTKISAIGKYRITELVGEGAMGVVYRAVDTVLDRTVAIKVMSESIARNADLRKRFLREAQMAGSLQHPNVVCIHDFGETDGHLFIAMEFIEGVDLERLIELREPLSLQTRLDIMIDVLTGLAYAHKRGIVHRDIKPANIRVGEDGRVRVMDFGVAHLASSSMTSTGAILGTPSYMAPEQITEGKASAASDIFTVGAVLYQLLTSVRPFDAPTLQNLLFRIVTENPRPVSELVPELPRALNHIVEKAMAKEPSERYAEALEMANDLITVRSGLSGPSYPASASLSASVASAIEQSRGSSRQRKRTLAYVGGGVLAAASIVAIALSQVRKPGAAKLEAAEYRAPLVTSPSLPVITPPSLATAKTDTQAARASPRVVLAAPRSATRTADTTVTRSTSPQLIPKPDQPAKETSKDAPTKETSSDPRKELASIGVTWSTQSFVEALEASDARIVRLFLDGGMSPTVLHKGASAVLYILQPLLPDPIPMLKLLIEKGYDVNAILTDATIMRKYGSVPPYWDPAPDLPDYNSFYHVFSGPALMWVAMRAAYAGPTPSDLSVIDFLRQHGADTRLTLRFLAAMESGWGHTPVYQTVRARVTR